MKITKVKLLENPSEYEINNCIGDYQKAQYECKKILSNIGYTGGYSTKHIVTIIFEKEI